MRLRQALHPVNEVLLDTNWIINFLKGRQDATDLVAGLLDRGLVLSVVSYGETYEGIVNSPDFNERVQALDDLALLTGVLSTDIEIAIRYARTRSELRATGQLIPDNDLWIAATALAHNLELVTRDRHFERVPGLKLYSPVR
jgi:tRNA(fMet)-specific endonuclease VapC